MASMHFNENLKRRPSKKADGSSKIQVTYPKFKFGEEVVRDVACPPTYGKIFCTSWILKISPLNRALT